MTDAIERPVLELRVALTTEDYDRRVRFYAAGLGVAPAELSTTATTRAILLDQANRPPFGDASLGESRLHCFVASL